MSLTTNVVSSNPAQTRCTFTLCDKVCQWLATGRYFSPDTPLSSTNKTDCHDITEILVKVALNTINKQNYSNVLTSCSPNCLPDHFAPHLTSCWDEPVVHGALHLSCSVSVLLGSKAIPLCFLELLIDDLFQSGSLISPTKYQHITYTGIYH